MENKFSKKYFQLIVYFNGFNSEIGFSQKFHFKPFPDSRAKRERERERERKKREPRSCLRLRWRPQSPDHAFDFVDLRTHESIFDLEPSTHRSTNSRTDLRPTSLRLRRRPRAFAPRMISLSLWFWFSVWFWSIHEPIYVSLWFWFFTLSLISDFFVVVVVVWVVVFWWFSCCVVMGFVWVVVENNIFRMLPNTWKYFLEQFS